MKFTESHEWIEIQGNIGTVGVTKHAQKELGDIVYVELPKVGKSVQRGEAIAVLESTKAAVDVYAPVSGTVIEINETLKERPELINEGPETTGWLFKIELSDKLELENLLDASAYELMIT
jgi:glycine cleavage system H protein